MPIILHTEPETKPPNRTQFLASINGCIDNKEITNKELSTVLKRRRDRYARQAHHIVQQQELLNNSNNIYNGLFGTTNGNYSNGNFGTNENYSNGTQTSTNGFPSINVHMNGSDHYSNKVHIQHAEETTYNRISINHNVGDVFKNGLFILLTTC